VRVVGLALSTLLLVAVTAGATAATGPLAAGAAQAGAGMGHGAAAQSGFAALSDQQWYLDTLGVRGLAEQGIDGRGVVVAVLDSGFQHDHADWSSRAWTNTAEVPGNGIDDDLNGYADDVHGWDMCHDAPARVRPGFFHGTFVAGVLGADGREMGGMMGIAPGVTMMDVQVFCDDDTYPQREGVLAIDIVREGIRYATAMGADIISMSLQKWPDQAPGLLAGLLSLEEEFQVAHDAGIVLVGAAGNLGEAGPSSPGDMPHVLTVGATTGCGFRHDFSNHGPGIDLWAPGSAVSAMLGGGYEWAAGTSFATPMVAGAAALLLQQEPELAPDDVVARLLAAATASEDGPAMDLHDVFQVPRAATPPAPEYLGPTTVGALQFLQFRNVTPLPPLLGLAFPGVGAWCLRTAEPDVSFYVAPEGLPEPLRFGARFHNGRASAWENVTLAYDPAVASSQQLPLLADVEAGPGGDEAAAAGGVLGALLLAASAFVRRSTSGQSAAAQQDQGNARSDQGHRRQRR